MGRAAGQRWLYSFARRGLRRALDRRMGGYGRSAIREDCDMAVYVVIVIGDFLEGEAEVEADASLAAAKAAVAQILEEEGDLPEWANSGCDRRR